MSTPSVTTDRTDYAPGSTATFTARDFSAGTKIQFQVVNLGADGLYGTRDDLVYKAWIVADGSSADASGLAGVVETSWVLPASARDRDLRLIATEDTNGDGVFGGAGDQSATASFSDAAGTTNKVYQHWADGDAATRSAASWNNNILSANKSDYFEGEVIPHVFIYKASNQAPLTKDGIYSFTVTYNEYQGNTNAGGFAYMTTYDVSRAPGPLGVTSPAITPALDAAFTNGGGFTGATGLQGGSGFYTVDADILSVTGVTPSGNGTRDGNVTLTFKYTGTTTTNGVAEVYYGLYIAPPGVVAGSGPAPTDGANAWTGGSLQTTVTVGKSGATSIQLAPAAIIAGEISGTKFNDLDGDATRDVGEPGLAGWTIVLDTDNVFSNGVLKTAVTDASGVYTFSVTPDADKAAGGNNPYVVYEVQQPGWAQTTANPGPITISALDPYEFGVDFGNRQQMPTILLDKSAQLVTGTDGLNAGDTIVYTFVVTNTGNVALTGVVVADDPASFELNDPGDPADGAVPNPQVIGNLAVGASATVTSIYVLTQEDLDDLYAGSQNPGSALFDGVDNVATATGYFGTQAVTSTDSARVSGFALDPRLALTKTGVWVDSDEDGYAELGEFIEYRFTVSNVGNVSLTGVTVGDPKLAVSGGPVTLAVGEIDSTSFSGTHALTQADIDEGHFYNLATADSNESGPATDDEDVALPQDPAIELIKSGSFVDANANAQADVGEFIVYTFAITNTSNVTLYDLQVTDPLIQVQGGPLALLAPGGIDAATFTGAYAVTQADIDRGYVDNVATVRGVDLQGDPAVDDDDHTQPLAQNPAILLEKTGTWADGDGDGHADVGEVVSYSFRVENTGNVTLYGVTVSDPLVTVSGGPVTLAVGAVDSSSFSGSYVLTQADIDAGFVDNLATAQGADAQGDLASDDDDHTALLAQNARIDVEKEISVDGVNWLDADAAPGPLAFEGTSPQFRFKVQNTGNVTLEGVTLTDSDFDLNGAAAGTAVTIGTLAPGATAFNGGWLSYTAAWQSGQHANTATASGTWSGGTATDTDLAHYMGAMPPVVIVGNPQFNFPNDLEKIQPKLQGGGADQFTINPDGYISWDLYTPDTAKAWIDTAAGYSSGYSGLTVSILEVWNSSGTLGTSGAQAIYRVYVANETDTPVQMVNSTNVVVYDIVAESKDKGTVDLINADPLIGNFNSFSNIENAIDKATNGFVTSPSNPYTGTASADKVWTSGSLAGTAYGETAISADGGAGADAIYGRNNDGPTSGDDALRGGAGNDLLEARAGGDAVYGDAGDDRLFGSLGADILSGGDGMDVLFGGYGVDRLTGGAGADRFVVRLSDGDLITDFSRGEGDRIHLWTGGQVTQADLRYEGGVLWVDDTPVVQLVGAPELVLATDVSIGLRP